MPPRQVLVWIGVVAILFPLAVFGEPSDTEGRSGIPPLELFVTDKKGRPVTDLGEDEVELRIDGKSVGLSDFYRVQDGTPVDGDSGPAPRLLVVYFDLLHLRVTSRTQMVRKLETFLPQEGEIGVETMLVSSDGTITIHENFTTDSIKLRKGLQAIERIDAGVSSQGERRALDCLLGDSTKPECGRIVQQYVAEIYDRAIRALPPLEGVILDLGNIPGRKTLLYVTDGLPLKPAEEVQRLMQGDPGMTGTYDLTEQIDHLADAAATNGVAFYSYRTGALTLGLSSAAHSFDPSSAGSMFASHREQNFQAGPSRLSLRTGGWYGNGLKEIITWLQSDLGSYYVLDFSPDVRSDGRYHSVKIKVDRKKIVVRHPDGYFDAGVRNPRF
jgi:VWFA-related protein